MNIRKTLGRYNPWAKIRELQARLDDAGQMIDGLQEQIDGFQEKFDVIDDELDRARRIKGEYFALIEQLEGERDQWREMYREQSVGHLEAQNNLVMGLRKSRQLAERLQRALNAMIKKYQPESGEVTLVPKIGDPPEDQVRKFKESLQMLEKMVDNPTDAKAERAAIDAAYRKDT